MGGPPFLNRKRHGEREKHKEKRKNSKPFTLLHLRRPPQPRLTQRTFLPRTSQAAGTLPASAGEPAEAVPGGGGQRAVQEVEPELHARGRSHGVECWQGTQAAAGVPGFRGPTGQRAGWGVQLVFRLLQV